MEEYLHHMKTLRSQINDVEDQAAKILAEEQIYLSTIQTLQNDLHSAKSETKQLRDHTEKMLKLKGQTCSQIIAKQRKISSLESDSSTLSQTLALIQQEKMSLGSKLVEKSTYYSKTAKDLCTKLQQQQDSLKYQKVDRKIKEHSLVNNILDEETTESEDGIIAGSPNVKNHLIMEYKNGNDLIVKLDLAKAKFNEIAQIKAKLVTDNGKIKVSIEQAKRRASNFKPELLALSIMTLEEEHKALLSDKDGVTEYLCSLQHQVEQIKRICHVIKCACGEEYRVNVGADKI